jgi:type IV fimbrial biogenesis protein FimT
MLKSLAHRRSLGFSLVELMIGITVMAILLSVAVPSFQTMMQNTQVRNAAEAISNGLQRARAEAVARNTNVIFTLGVNTAWTISIESTAAVIESRSANEGSANVTVDPEPDGASVITFNNLGGVVPNAASLTSVVFRATGTSKELQVNIGAGGNAKMCDPELDYATNSRGCPP